jgi:hypothetical protein
MRLCVTNETPPHSDDITIESVKWQGLACKITLNKTLPGLMADIRKTPADKNSAYSFQPRPVKEDGIVNLYISEDFEGHDGFVVILDQNDSIVTQIKTSVPGE